MADLVKRLNAALEGRYRIDRELGAGGMATVYLAEDLRHRRKVAVKVLKPELAAVLGGERFVQEITTTASLQHPHILPLFDSGTADGFLFYVMPYIEGETLRDRLDRETQLGIDEAVRITREVADALDYAHRQGIIHRDIKPENILLHDGRPMVADFGIALAVSAAAGGRMTETGTSVGTPHYMSPEQATADKEITGRADQYSLASVLYEMLTGDPPHTGSSAQQVIMRIIADTARPVTELRKSVPPNVAAAVMKALEKLPADRFDSAKALADALADPHFTTATVTAIAPRAVPGVRAWLRYPFTWAALAIAAAAVLVAAWRSAVPGESAGGPVVRAEIEVLPGVDGSVGIRGIDISPDGSAITYSADPPGGAETPPVLMLRRLEDRAPHAIPGTEGAVAVAFSPDGQSLAFAVREAGIRRVPIGGGAVQSVVNDTSIDYVQGLRWATDGYLYYDNKYPPGISRVPALGGAPERLLADTLSLDYSRNISQTGDPKDPVPLPGGRHVLYTECCQDQYGDVHALDLTTGETRSLGVRASRVVYMENGYLLLIRPDGIDARLFDAQRLEFRGEPFPVLDSVSANGEFRLFAVSRNGSAVYTVNPAQGERTSLSLVDLDGRPQRLPLPEVEFYLALEFSPDGRSIAAAARSSTATPVLDLVVHDLLIGGTSRHSIANVRDVAWMPDGRRLLVSTGAEGGGASAILIAQADGTGVPDTLLTTGSGEEFTELSIAPDGAHVLIGTSARGNSDLHVATLDSTIGPLSDYLAADWDERRAAISPDGAWVAYESAEEPTIGYPRRVYARTFPVPGERFTVSDGNGAGPLWAPDGRTIYYWTEGAIIAAAVQTSPTFAVTGRRTLFQLPGISQRRRYDIHPDGTRFVMETLATDTLRTGRVVEPMRLVIVGNWIDEFMRKAEAGR